jgi:hypothetical protein
MVTFVMDSVPELVEKVKMSLDVAVAPGARALLGGFVPSPR